MDTILDMTKKICLLFFCLLPTDVAWDYIFFLLFMLGHCIGIFLVNGSGHHHNGCNLFMIQCNG